MQEISDSIALLEIMHRRAVPGASAPAREEAPGTLSSGEQGRVHLCPLLHLPTPVHPHPLGEVRAGVRPGHAL